MRFSFCILALCILSAHATPIVNYKKVLDDTYKDISGYSIDQTERDLIQKSGGSPTYGEITYEGCQKLFALLKLAKHDVFYDLGSGVGKCVAYAVLTTPIKKGVGVELSKERHHGAKQAKKELHRQRHLKHRNLEFINKDITRVPLTDATAIFMNSLCFSDEFMTVLLDKLARLKHGLRVATLKQFAPNPYFKLMHTDMIPMSWAKEGSSVYFYELIQPKKSRKKTNKHSHKTHAHVEHKKGE